MAGKDHIIWNIVVTNIGNVDLLNIYVNDGIHDITFCPGSMSYQVGNEVLSPFKFLLGLPAGVPPISKFM